MLRVTESLIDGLNWGRNEDELVTAKPRHMIIRPEKLSHVLIFAGTSLKLHNLASRGAVDKRCQFSYLTYRATVLRTPFC